MTRFAPALRRVARELDLPRDVRAPILLEIAGDLEAVYEHHRRGGATEQEAVRKAEEQVLGSAEVMDRLARLHEGSWRGWSASVGARLERGTDLVLLICGVAPAFVLVATVCVRELAGSDNPVMWPLIAVGLATAGVVALEAYRLVGRGTGGELGRGLPYLLVLSAVAPSLGMLTLLVGLHSTLTSLSTGMSETQVIATRASRDGSALLVGLLLGIAGVLSWFILLNRASIRIAREVDALLEDTPATLPVRRPDGVLPLARRRHA